MIGSINFKFVVKHFFVILAIIVLETFFMFGMTRDYGLSVTIPVSITVVIAPFYLFVVSSSVEYEKNAKELQRLVDLGWVSPKAYKDGIVECAFANGFKTTKFQSLYYHAIGKAVSEIIHSGKYMALLS